jgi:long-subunit fatty acid transport protein
MLQKRTMELAVSAAAALSVLAMVNFGAGAANAGGLYVNEFGSPSTGTAGAGAQAWADDASIT